MNTTTACWLMLTLALGCGDGGDGITDAMAGDGSLMDGSSSTDARPTDARVSADAPAAGDSSVTTQSCDTPCGERALCDPDSSRCVCIAGYDASGDECVVSAVPDPTTRSEEATCALWREGRASRGGPAFLNEGGATCGPGELPFAAHMEALSYLNTYRRLSGVGPLTLNTGADVPVAEQECAVLQALNGGISHEPPMDWTCWTSRGASAAGNSYIAWGFSTAALTVDGYIRETQSRLSHRRGLLAVGRAGVYFGHFQSGGCCRYQGSNPPLDSDPPLIFYPNEGFAPAELFNAKWSVIQGTASSARYIARVFVDATDEEREVRMDGSFGGFSAWTQEGWRVEVGTTYRVELTAEDGSVVTYRTTPVTCL